MEFSKLTHGAAIIEKFLMNDYEFKDGEILHLPYF